MGSKGSVPNKPLTTLHLLNNSGGLNLGSLHSSYVIHCVSRNYTWNAAYFFCIVDGVGDYIEE